MAEQHCIYPDREAVIVAYLYDDIEAVDRVTFETHVTTCEPCRTELADLRGVRSTLAQWAAPESTRRSLQSPVPGLQSHWWHAVPVWAQVAAAMLVLGVSASIANLDVRYDRAAGLSVRTGWSKPASTPAAVVVPVADSNPAPWREELAVMQAQLRKEIRAQAHGVAAASAEAPAAALTDAEFRRVREILDDSERKQKKDLALQLVQLQQDMYAQRQADFGQLYRAIGFVQTATNKELANQARAISLVTGSR